MTLNKIVLLAAAIAGAAAQAAPAEEMALTLREAREMALAQNAMLQSARQELAAARGQRSQTAAGFLPSVRISETWMRTNDAVGAFGTRLRQERFTQADFALTNLNGPAPITSFETRLEVRQPIFNGGLSFARRGQASAGERAAEAGLRHAENEIEFNAARAYWGFVLAQKGLQAVLKGVEAARSAVSMVEAHYAEGNVPLSDLLGARVRLAEVEASQSEAENSVSTAQEGLSLVLGLPADAVVTVTDTLGDPGALADSQPLLETAEERPDVQMHFWMSQAARKGTRAASAGWVPHLNAFLDAALDSEKPFKRQGERWTVGAMLTWDLFDGGRTIGAHREARARARSAESRLTFARAAAERDVRQAIRDLSASRHRLALAEAIVAQSVERHRITVLRYQEGLATTTDLVSSEAALTGAHVKHARILHDVNVNAAKLAFSSGLSQDELVLERKTQ